MRKRFHKLSEPVELGWPWPEKSEPSSCYKLPVGTKIRLVTQEERKPEDTESWPGCIVVRIALPKGHPDRAEGGGNFELFVKMTAEELTQRYPV